MPVASGPAAGPPAFARIAEREMRNRLLRLARDERGQDLIEYALLTSAVGFAAIAVFGVIETAIQTVFVSWNVSTNSHWYPPDP